MGLASAFACLNLKAPLFYLSISMNFLGCNTFSGSILNLIIKKYNRTKEKNMKKDLKKQLGNKSRLKIVRKSKGK